MARLGCWLGVLLMAVAFAALFALIVLPVIGPFRDNATLMSLQAAISCPEGYNFENEFTTYSRPGETMDVATGYCISPDNEQRIQLTGDQQGRFILISIGAFVIPFITGLILFIVAVGTMSRNQVSTAFRTGNMAFGMNPGRSAGRGNVTYVSTTADNLDPKTAEWIKRTTGLDLDALQQSGQWQAGDTPVIYASNLTSNGASHSNTAANTSSGISLSERLKQIDDAREQGLITREEYERLRKAILDDMG
jgi:hypothetical protein